VGSPISNSQLKGTNHMTTLELATAIKAALGEGNTLKAFALCDAIINPAEFTAPAPEPAPKSERMTGKGRGTEAVIEDAGLHLKPGSHAADAPRVRK
jgi:hypothetical protein